MSNHNHNRNIPMSEVSEALGVSVQGARKWCKKNNCAVKVGGRYFLTYEKFMANFPELAERVEDPEDYTTCQPCK